jgi:S-adenosylhomocysteine hydrolase
MEAQSDVEKSGDFKIKDIGLHEYGRQEIEMAQVEMPGLMSCVSKYGGGKPFAEKKNIRFPSHDNSNRCVG